MSNDPYIHVMNSLAATSVVDVDGRLKVDLDRGPLAMPDSIRIGAKSWDGHEITSYAEQVGEYGVWLEDRIRAADPTVLAALDDVYARAAGSGVILTTVQLGCGVTHTHAHEVRRAIMELASNLEDQPCPPGG